MSNISFITWVTFSGIPDFTASIRSLEQAFKAASGSSWPSKGAFSSGSLFLMVIPCGMPELCFLALRKGSRKPPNIVV